MDGRRPQRSGRLPGGGRSSEDARPAEVSAAELERMIEEIHAEHDETFRELARN